MVRTGSRERGEAGAADVKAARQRRIVRLLEERTVASQNELALLLQAAGYRATQATVSRDLEELGVVKVRRGGQVAYALASSGSAPSPTDALSLALVASVLGIEGSGNLIVVRTPPGHAHMVASALDAAVFEGVAGTVAGDDTVLVVVREGVPPRDVEQRLRSLAGMPKALVHLRGSPVGTESPPAPRSQGARRAPTGRKQPTSNAASGDAEGLECQGNFREGALASNPVGPVGSVGHIGSVALERVPPSERAVPEEEEAEAER